MEDKYKNLILWFLTLPLFLSIISYGFSKDLQLAFIVAMAALPLGIGGAYINYRNGRAQS